MLRPEPVEPTATEPRQIATLTLEQIPEAMWQLLQLGCDRASDPFHTPCLATIGHDGPTSRTVVLRHVDAAQRLLVCHTDTRSSKAGEIQQEPRTSWHFYDRERKLQLRLAGATVLHTDDALADACWARCSERSRACYNTGIGPGQRVSRPPVAPSPIGSEPEEEDARSHFAAVVCHVTSIDWLCLSGAGHRRARFRRNGGSFIGTWVTP